MPTAKDALFPHRTGSGCPAIIQARGGWSQWEREVDALIAIADGADPPEPEPVYAKAVPVPKAWDGTDWVRGDGARFIALRRVFVAAKDGVHCRQSASESAPDVRRPMSRGEGFEAYYLVIAGEPWLVSRYGSRIKASECTPALAGLLGATTRRGADYVGAALLEIVIDDPTRGLSAVTVPDDAPAVGKAVFFND